MPEDRGLYPEQVLDQRVYLARLRGHRLPLPDANPTATDDMKMEA
ncbi:hypothetical protein ACQPZ2_18625 [Nocardia pseudovaccinii]